MERFMTPEAPTILATRLNAPMPRLMPPPPFCSPPAPFWGEEEAAAAAAGASALLEMTPERASASAAPKPRTPCRSVDSMNCSSGAGVAGPRPAERDFQKLASHTVIFNVLAPHIQQ